LGILRYQNTSFVDIICTNPDGSDKFWLNDFDEESLISKHKTICGFKTKPDYDQIIILQQDKLIQGTLF
jgi:hypothetical protein